MSESIHRRDRDPINITPDVTQHLQDVRQEIQMILDYFTHGRYDRESIDKGKDALQVLINDPKTPPDIKEKLQQAQDCLVDSFYSPEKNVGINELNEARKVLEEVERMLKNPGKH